ncbi:463_t:CDS:2 [Funneliformis mosseae]|uniref:463_t:CDS:1 n=1 Tax=Funneliformis mosseae TaxID=27381 RepID=A0A9N9BIV5_FUNMO|nr:463_t:CDS:2 [Funneliformis mosseae]
MRKFADKSIDFLFRLKDFGQEQCGLSAHEDGRHHLYESFL